MIFAVCLLVTSVAAQKATVTSKQVTYTRKNPISEYKKTFTVQYPKIKARTPALSKKIETALSYEKAFGFTIAEEMGELQWLEAATYDAVFNSGKVLSMNLNIEGSAAYPSGSTKTVVVDTSTGVKQTAAMVFTNLNGLVAMVTRDQKKEIAQSIKNLREDPEMKDPDPAELFEGKTFSTKDLEGFSVDGKGVTFYYDYGFPHAIQASEPSGYYFYRWNQIKRYIKPAGLLDPLAR